MRPAASSTPKRRFTLASAQKRKAPESELVDRPQHHSTVSSMVDHLDQFDGNNITPQDMLSISEDDCLLLPGQVSAQPSHDIGAIGSSTNLVDNTDPTNANDFMTHDLTNKNTATYPVLLSTNVRSIFPKIDCFCTTLCQEGVGIGFITELWMDKCNPLHIKELDRRLNLDGFEFITNARQARRGGGVAVVVNTRLGYTVRKLNVNCTTGASSLEVVWSLVTLPTPIDGFRNIICVCFYSPPRSKLNKKLLNHLQYNLNRLTAVHPKSGVCIGGDINNLEIQRLLDCFPDTINLVTTPTYGTRILDVLVTNLHPGYDKAVVRPPIQPDVSGHGAQSDHSVAIAFPNLDKSRITGFSRKEIRRRRNVTASNLLGLAAFFACFDWRVLHNLTGADAKLQYLENVAVSAQDLFCPMKPFVVC